MKIKEPKLIFYFIFSADQKLSSLEEKQQEGSKAAEEWEEKYQALKMANSMLGSNTNKTEAKLKINTLIRVLDDCIAQLSA